MKLSDELTWRGFVNQTTLKNIKELDNASLTFYWGVDPSAPSMTIGHLAMAMMVRHFVSHGHKAVLLVGGATGMIGDPDGKNEERTLKTTEEINDNKKAIALQYEQVFGGLEFKLVDNYEWFKGLDYLRFLREIGKHVPMRQMLGREFVQERLKDNGGGISYAEFSYSLIQGYDFLHLFREMGVTLQVAGSDQWGNSIAGVDLIRRMTGKQAHVWTAPLIINKLTGKKFGKSEEGALWLDPELTSPFKFYQFWLNVDDAGVEDYLKIYTTLTQSEVQSIMNRFKSNPGERLAQKSLAYEATKITHGLEQAETQSKISVSLFSRNFQGFSASDFKLLERELPFMEVGEGIVITEVLVETGLASSKSDARQLISDGAITSSQRVDLTSSETVLQKKDSLNGYIVIFKGKKYPALIKVK